MAIERAHRLGSYSPDKCRPIIAKFSNYKVKEKVLSARKLLKDKDITICDDYSPATRHIRSKLISFAKQLPGKPLFHLRYNKLVVNKKQYTYDPVTDSVTECTSQHTHANTEPRTAPPNLP